LAVLWPQPGGAISPTGAVAQSTPQRTSVRVLPETPSSPNVWSVRHEADEMQSGAMPSEERLAGDLVLVESGPILRAFGPFPSSIVN